MDRESHVASAGHPAVLQSDRQNRDRTMSRAPSPRDFPVGVAARSQFRWTTGCRRARDAGAVVLEEPADMTYGDRRAMVRDRWGNIWQIATHGGAFARSARGQDREFDAPRDPALASHPHTR